MKTEKFIEKHLNAIMDRDGAWDIMLEMLFQRSVQKMFVEDRRRQGLTRKHLADKMGIGVDELWVLENKRYPDYKITTLQTWSRALGLRLDLGVVDTAIPQNPDDEMANACYRFHDAEPCVPGLNHPGVPG